MASLVVRVLGYVGMIISVPFLDSDKVKASYMPITVDFSKYAATESAAKSFVLVS